MTVIWKQGEVEMKVRQQFPASWLQDVSFPFIESVLAERCFPAYATWVAENVGLGQ